MVQSDIWSCGASSLVSENVVISELQVKQPECTFEVFLNELVMLLWNKNVFTAPCECGSKATVAHSKGLTWILFAGF